MNKENKNIYRDEDLIRQQHINILALKRLKVLDHDNNEVFFSKFWEQTTIIVFVRHFGCIACRARVDQISKFYSDMKNKEMRVIFIGNGQPHMIKTFKEDLGLPKAQIYTDPTLKVFDACGMNRSFMNLVNVRSITAMRKLAKEGYAQGSFSRDTGTHRQMGGVVALEKPGKVLYHFTSEFLGDFDNPTNWPSVS